MEERQHNKELIMAAEDFTGDKADVVRPCKQIMNKCASKRLISKQEAMVLLADLPLTVCTEGFEAVSLAHSQQVTLKGKLRDDKKFITQHATRDVSFENMSLHECFHHVKNPTKNERHMIPNFVGTSGIPRCPVTPDYARHTIIAYRPWRQHPKDLEWIKEFNQFINSEECPVSAKMGCERNYDKMQHCEPKAQTADHSGNELSEESRKMLELLGLRGDECTDHDDALFKSMDFGKNFEWDKDTQVSPSKCPSFSSFSHVVFQVTDPGANLQNHYQTETYPKCKVSHSK